MILTAILSLSAMPCLAQPRWVSIFTPTEPYQYFHYWNDGYKPHAVEMDKFDAKNPHPGSLPRPIYLEPDVGNLPVPQRTACKLENRPGVYWYTPDGKSLNGTFPTPSPSQFNVSALQENIKGFAVAATFGGFATNASDSIYFTDRACSDGGTEFGFSNDFSGGLLVYWSTFANCANDAASLCRKTDNPSLGPNFSNVQQESGGVGSSHGFRIFGLDRRTSYTYKMFIENHRFRIEVWKGSELAQCHGSEGAVLRPCSFDELVEPWFPIDAIRSGYIVLGTQTTGKAVVASDTGTFKVSDILVLK